MRFDGRFVVRESDEVSCPKHGIRPKSHHLCAMRRRSRLAVILGSGRFQNGIWRDYEWRLRLSICGHHVGADDGWYPASYR
ncbi:hypothetical protein [Paraburkholderia aromaticivorans]|uniref:hypothetical protein n=1 Tax=Paraburkholderia aromaticivorans TaxID=2026199 RepID=UPI003D66D140